MVTFLVNLVMFNLIVASLNLTDLNFIQVVINSVIGVSIDIVLEKGDSLFNS